MQPSGAWLNFYQTVADDAIPYEVGYQHLDPYQGELSKPIELSGSPLLVAGYTPGKALRFSTDSGSQGKFSLVADAAFFYAKGAPLAVSGQSGQTLSLSSVPPPEAAATTTLDFIFDMALLGTGMGPDMGKNSHGHDYPTTGSIFVTHGGMIIDSLGDATVDAAMRGGGGGCAEAEQSARQCGWGRLRCLRHRPGGVSVGRRRPGDRPEQGEHRNPHNHKNKIDAATAADSLHRTTSSKKGDFMKTVITDLLTSGKLR